MDAIRGASFAAIFGMLICLVPALAGIWFALRPSERLLSLMRPLSLAAIFAALCTFGLAVTNGARTIGHVQTFDAEGIRLVGMVVAEGFAGIAVSFAFLTVAWICVAVGMRRRDVS